MHNLTDQEILDLADNIMEKKMRYGAGFTSPADTARYLVGKMHDKEVEVFAAMMLDSQHRIIEFVELSHGTVDSAVVYPREVAKHCLNHNAAAVIFTHNHPSGVPEPSQADRKITNKLIEALSLFDIRVLDHVVVGGTRTVSFAERGLI